VLEKLSLCGIVTMTTDFGLADPYVAAMKGVVLSRRRDAVIVDVSHDVPAFDPRAASYVLSRAWAEFPRGTVHLVIVDPGVGGTRRALVVECRDHVFVGPDNGCLEESARAAGVRQVWLITGSDRPVSPTFHGRDLFAPMVGDLLAGRVPGRRAVPAATGALVRLPRATRRGRAGRGQRLLAGTVQWIDRFGNLVTTLGARDVAWLAGARAAAKAPPSPLTPRLAGRLTLRVGETDVARLARTYAEAPRGVPFLVWGSGDLLEVSVREGSAARVLRASVGCPVRATVSPASPSP
jgi:S-adenosylmethionine hydrolase